MQAFALPKMKKFPYTKNGDCTLSLKNGKKIGVIPEFGINNNINNSHLDAIITWNSHKSSANIPILDISSLPKGDSYIISYKNKEFKIYGNKSFRPWSYNHAYRKWVMRN